MNNFKKSGALVKVSWGDAWGSSGWANTQVALKEHKSLAVTNYGIVVKHDKDGITLASGQDENGSYLGIGFVPSGMIKRIVSLGK